LHSNRGHRHMLHGRRVKQSSIFEYRLEEEAINLRKQAEGMPPGIPKPA
jgi:hypothetical protein